MKKDSRLMTLALSGVPLIMVLGNSMLIPEFPRIKAALELNQLQVGLLITVFSISAGLTIPILGYVCDQIGRLKVIIPALLVYGSGGLICGLAALFLEQPYNIILAGRVVQGIGAAGTAPIVMALIGDVFQSEERSSVLGIIESANGIGKVISPILGSALGLISWIALFFFYALLAVPIAAGVYFFSEEGHKPEAQPLTTYLTDTRQLVRKKGITLLATILAGMLVLFALFGLLSFFSDLLENKYQIRGFTKGLVIAIPIIFMSTTSFLNGLLLKRIKKYFKLFIILGLALVTVSLISLNYIETLTYYLLCFSLLGTGAGLILPAVNTMITSSTAASQRGVITSIYGSARFIGVAIGPPLFSLLEEISSTFMYLGSSGIVLGGLVIGAFFIKEKGMRPPA